MLQALTIYAGSKAKAHIAKNGLQAKDVRVVAGAAGGPKGLILLALDRFIFGQWLAQSQQKVDLVGASIGAWRMATACMRNCASGFEQLARDYIAQDYPVIYNRRGKPIMPSASFVSQAFGASLTAFYEAHVQDILHHPRFQLHVIAARGRKFLRQMHGDQRFEMRTVLGFSAAFMANLFNRSVMGAWLERVVFSTGLLGDDSQGAPVSGFPPLPFDTGDYRTSRAPLLSSNFHQALQASCAIPFALNAVPDIAHAPHGSYWDGGLTDYQCHLNYAARLRDDELVLIPHFQQHLIAGWLDKSLVWRHKSSTFLDHVVVLAPSASFIQQLPNCKMPDRHDFQTYREAAPARQDIWRMAVSQSEQLVDDFQRFLSKPHPGWMKDL